MVESPLKFASFLQFAICYYLYFTLPSVSVELSDAKWRQEEVVKSISNLENENKKLSKSRDRLKSLLDEKERSVSELQMEKAKLTGSQA